MTLLYNQKPQTQRRKKLRNNPPPAELTLWSHLKNKQMLGYKFRRQYGIDNFILDFYCPKLRLAIEIDGDSHFQDASKVKDERKQKHIESFGVKFLRFTNHEIYLDLERVLKDIKKACEH